MIGLNTIAFNVQNFIYEKMPLKYKAWFIPGKPIKLILEKKIYPKSLYYQKK